MYSVTPWSDMSVCLHIHLFAWCVKFQFKFLSQRLPVMWSSWVGGGLMEMSVKCRGDEMWNLSAIQIPRYKDRVGVYVRLGGGGGGCVGWRSVLTSPSIISQPYASEFIIPLHTHTHTHTHTHMHSHTVTWPTVEAWRLLRHLKG